MQDNFKLPSTYIGFIFCSNFIQAAENAPIEGVEPEAADNAQEEGNWNPIEWDRAVEELTWERLLGLDGSLVLCKKNF